ncbi:MAG: hypothetical protein J0J10_14460 [Bosea sp.]|uniref:hypothetical protein n=1 Tax=Bosea sp. (in: a-proteobacteria) TaxID=1871050 RepID=UPI001ACC49F5|nr:hypothetical protein [Bosea sp. (in: a-proteobacteria)]MBN9469965.1 hypothetical protein [Bosea sp. (in: a-proteobacteria)]
MTRLGKHQLGLLSGLGSPSMRLVVACKLSDSLERQGLLKSDHSGGFVGITPAGLRRLADELEAGRLAHLMPKYPDPAQEKA